MAATPAIAVREVIDVEGAAWWLQGALGELYAMVAAPETHAARSGWWHVYE